MSVASLLLATQTYSAASTGWGWRMVRLLCSVPESRLSSVIMILTWCDDSCVRLFCLHHVISGVRTPLATQMNTAGLGDTTVVLMGGIMIVVGAGRWV